MAQERFHEYDTEVTSFEERRKYRGVLPAGRYSGFDTMNDAAGVGINIDLAHDLTGFLPTDSSNDIEATLQGCLVTPHGTIAFIDNTEAVNLAIDTNAANSNKRIDLVVAEHEYNAVTGGQAITFSVIKGSTDSYTRPALSSPETQTPIGEVHINATGSTFADCAWNPDTPGVSYPGDGSTFRQDESDITLENNKGELPNGANYVNVQWHQNTQNEMKYLRRRPIGSMIFLRFTPLRNSSDALTITSDGSSYGADYAPIKADGYASVGNGDWLVLMMIATSEGGTTLPLWHVVGGSNMDGRIQDLEDDLAALSTSDWGTRVNIGAYSSSTGSNVFNQYWSNVSGGEALSIGANDSGLTHFQGHIETALGVGAEVTDLSVAYKPDNDLMFPVIGYDGVDYSTWRMEIESNGNVNLTQMDGTVPGAGVSFYISVMWYKASE